MTDVPKNELWMVDIKKYIYEIVKNYYPILQKVKRDSIFYTMTKKFKEIEKPMILITDIWWSTNSVWVRNQSFQFDVYAYSIEEVENIQYLLIDLFNRRNLDWIRSSFDKNWPDMSNEKTWLFRRILMFDFVFKDMKF